mmetsp:Transcript_106548/g.270592  ORF Transcript_106548/g.270592 Transcript_106548/m.270592 type:complete len:323 (+) Transcript_106548:81-1049(+)
MASTRRACRRGRALSIAVSAVGLHVCLRYRPTIGFTWTTFNGACTSDRAPRALSRAGAGVGAGSVADWRRRDGGGSLAGTASLRAAHVPAGLAKRSRQAMPDGVTDILALAQLWVQEFPAYIHGLGPSGVLWFYAAFVGLECLSLPATPLLLSSGYVFGLPAGIAISLVSLCTAATISFFLARTILKPQLTKMAQDNATFQDINCAVQAEGFKIIFLLRLAPLLPFALSNYAYGLTQVGFFDFILATALGCAPGTTAFVYFATVARDAGSDDGPGTPWYVYAGGIVATAVLLKVVSDVAQKAVKDSIEADKEGYVARGGRLS